MTKYLENAAVAITVAVLIAVLSGCHKEDGPAEHAGKAIDKAMEKAGQQVEKAGQAIQDAAKGAGK